MRKLQNKKIIKGLKLATLFLSYELFLLLFYWLFIETLGFSFLEKIYTPFAIVGVFFHIPVFISMVVTRNFLSWNLAYVVEYILMFGFYFTLGYLMQAIKEKRGRSGHNSNKGD